MSNEPTQENPTPAMTEEDITVDPTGPEEPPQDNATEIATDETPEEEAAEEETELQEPAPAVTNPAMNLSSTEPVAPQPPAIDPTPAPAEANPVQDSPDAADATPNPEPTPSPTNQEVHGQLVNAVNRFVDEVKQILNLG